MTSRTWLALAASGVLALGLGACGSDDNDDTGTGGGSAAKVGGTINGAGATFPAPVYDEWAARFKDKQGTTVNYQAIGSGGGIAQFTAGTVDFGATDAAMKDEEVTAAKKKGDPVHVPTVFGAVTVSYNVDGVDKGLKLDGATVADVFLGKIKKWNDPKIAGQNSGVDLPGDDITVVPPLGRVGHDEALHDVPRGLLHGVEEQGRLRQDRQVADGHRRQGQRRRRRLRQADRRRHRLRRAGLRAPEQLHDRRRQEQGRQLRRADARVDVGRRRRPRPSRTTCASARSTRRATRRTRSPRPRSCSSTRTCARPASRRPRRKLVKDWLNYALGDGQKVAPELQYAPLPDAIKSKAQAKVDGLVCNGSPLGA